MPTVDVYNLERAKVGEHELSDDVFAAEVSEHLFHEVVRAQLAARRAGTAKTKERGEIRGSNAKPWRQKGTGRARSGSRKSPLWRGGGTVHGPRPRSYEMKVNKKVRRAALCAALSRRFAESRLLVIDGFGMPEIKTKVVAGVLQRFEMPKTLIVDVANPFLALSARNLAKAQYLPVEGVNVYDVLRHDFVMMTRAAADAITERLSR